MITWILMFVAIATVQAGVKYPKDVVLDLDLGAWTPYLDVDDAWNAWTSEGGDFETLAEINKWKGRSCSKSVPCTRPLAMEIGLSPEHLKLHPDANVNQILECSYLRADAYDHTKGFYCINNDQKKIEAPNAGCSDNCKKNGQFDIYNQIPGDNCFRCANFAVRYFCNFEDYDCVKDREPGTDY